MSMVFDFSTVSLSKEAMRDSSGYSMTYAELVTFIEDFGQCIPKRSFIFILSTNSVPSIAAFIACIENKIVPLVLGSDINQDRLEELISLYKPNFIWSETNSQDEDIEAAISCFGYSLLRTNSEQIKMYDNLAFLLSTSGSTGSPKLVRHSYENLKVSVDNVATLFSLSGEERAFAVLPLQYTMGLSVACSHLFAGATVLLSDAPMTSKEYWSFFKEHKATSFTGVPYNYEVLDKLRFFRMKLPDLTLLSQGGGKLQESLWEKVITFCDNHDIKFIATYGQTEGTARMAYLPPEFAATKMGSIGKSVKNGALYLEDDLGNKIFTPNQQGELIYEGANVTLGYAWSIDDLMNGDNNRGLLRTGDIAIQDEDGFFYIQGRKSRFLKIYGLRVGLDHLQRVVSEAFGVPCLCKGNDKSLEVLLEAFDGDVSKVKDFIVVQSGLFHKAIVVQIVSKFNRTDSGKIKL